jgi:hypothetical protein
MCEVNDKRMPANSPYRTSPRRTGKMRAARGGRLRLPGRDTANLLRHRQGSGCAAATRRLEWRL